MKTKVYLVVKKDLQYNDNFYDFTGGEKAIKAFRNREKAEQLARELSAQNEWEIDPAWDTDQDHQVIEVYVDIPDESQEIKS